MRRYVCIVYLRTFLPIYMFMSGMMLYINCKPVLHVCNVQCGDERGVHDAGMQSMHPCCCMHGYVPARRCTHKSTCACMYVGMHASARVRVRARVCVCVCLCVCVRT